MKHFVLLAVAITAAGCRPTTPTTSGRLEQEAYVLPRVTPEVRGARTAQPMEGFGVLARRCRSRNEGHTARSTTRRSRPRANRSRR